MRYFTFCLISLFASLILAFSKPSNAQYSETITVEKDIAELVQELLKSQSLDQITDFSSPKMQRDVVDFIMIQKALKLGGLDINFDLRAGYFDARNTKALATGHLLVSFDSMWLSEVKDLQDKIHISKPVVKKGNYWAGIFTSPTNKKALNIKTLEDFKQLSVVSSQAWSADWTTLQTINPQKLINEGNWLSMARLVSLGWVDTMLVTFNRNEPFAYKSKEYHIVAIQGVKIKLDDSRHYCVSKAHPLGQKTFEALEKGLAILQSQNAITKAYYQVGFYNQKVADWKVLNPN